VVSRVSVSPSEPTIDSVGRRRRVRDGRVRDPAGVHRHDVVGAVLAEPERAVAGDRPLHPGAPAEAVDGARHLLDRDLHVEPGQPAQLLGDDRRLEAALRRQRGVLEVAAAAEPRAGERAGRGHPVR